MYGLPDGVVFVLFILALIYSILLFLLPFYVFNIRNLLIKQNKLLTQIIANTTRSTGSRVTVTEDPSIKRCPHCGAKNRKMDYTCMSCSKPI